MPNHVTHRMTITGPAAAIETFIATFIQSGVAKNWKGEDEAYTNFDFNTLVPMPEILKDSESSSSVTDGLIVLGRTDIPTNLGMGRTAEEMLSWPWVVAEGVTDVDGLKALLLKRDPDCAKTAEAAIVAFEECGHASWYTWAIANWGTKWNAYDCSLDRVNDGELVVMFDCAWSVPEPVFEAMAARPELAELHVSIVAFDEGWNYAYEATIDDGKFVGDSVEATNELYEAVYGEPPMSDEEVEEVPEVETTLESPAEVR